jgi:hypothetical protein
VIESKYDRYHGGRHHQCKADEDMGQMLKAESETGAYVCRMRLASIERSYAVDYPDNQNLRERAPSPRGTEQRQHKTQAGERIGQWYHREGTLNLIAYASKTEPDKKENDSQ